MAVVLTVLNTLLLIAICALAYHTGYGDEIRNEKMIHYIKPQISSSSCPSHCLTLNEYVQTNYSSLSLQKLVFLGGNHELDANFSISYADNIYLEAFSNSYVAVHCIGQSGFLFERISNLKITDLSLVSCGFHSAYGHIPAITLNYTSDVILTNVTITKSPAGGSFIWHSSVYILNMICTDNTGNNSAMFVLRSDVFFLGNNTFSHNTALNLLYVGGINALLSNMTFNGTSYFFENKAQFKDANGVGFAALAVLVCKVRILGEMHFVKNYGVQSLSVLQSTFCLTGTIQFVGNEVDSASQFEVIFLLKNSIFKLTGNMNFTKNNGSMVTENSVFDVIGQILFDGNTLTKDYAHATLTIFNSVTNWTGQVKILNNIAQSSIAGLVVSLTRSNILGNILFINNSGYNSSGVIFHGTNLTTHGHMTIRDNFAVHETAGLVLDVCNAVINGSLNILNNTGMSNSYVFHSSLLVVGTMDFSNNIAIHGTTCFLSYNSRHTLSGNIIFENNFSDASTLHYFHNCTLKFRRRTVIQNNIAAKYGGGLAISASRLVLEDEYFILNNMSPNGDGGGIYAIDSRIVFKGSGQFANNTAKRGGAIHLFYGSMIDLKPGLLLHFEGNVALKGGAIHVDDTVNFVNCTNDNRLVDYSEPPLCFFDVSVNFGNTTLTFEDNKAEVGGHILYGGMLDKCYLRTSNNKTPLEIVNQLTTSDKAIGNSSAISSEPFRLCFCENGRLDCNFEEPTINARRGELFTVSVAALDQLNSNIIALVRSYLISGFNDTEKLLGNDGLLQKLDNKCTDLHYRVWSPNNFEQLVIYADGPCKDVGNASHTLQILFTECPIGFILQVDRCVCLPRILKYTNACNIDTGEIERPTNFWIGLTYNNNSTNSGLILHPNCPFDYCKWPSVGVRPTSPDTQCNYNRSMILCGSCVTNTSLLLGSSECSYCSNINVLLLIPFALIGIVLVSGLFMLKLTVATGSLHGLTFYANIVTVNQAILVPPDTFKGLSVFLSWVNLDFGIKACFYNGMDQYAKVWLQFVFPCYLLLLVIAIIVLCRYSIRASKLFGSNPVSVLATVILLSYTKILRNILAAFSYATLEYPGNEQVSVWLYDGNLLYIQGKHVALFVVALFVLNFFFIPYTLILLLAQLLQRNFYISSHSYFMKLRPFIDAYHAPYQTVHRYWTGLFLLLRCVLLLTFALNALGESSINLLAITTVCIGVGSISWIVHGIYSQRLLDILEASFIFNLGMFAAATYHVKIAGGNQAAVANISISIAFFTFVGIVFVHVYHRLKYLKKARCHKRSIATGRREENEESQNSDEDDMQQHVASNITFQVVPPPVRTELREPLLDY